MYNILKIDFFFFYLSEDPLMSKCLIYQLKPGKTVVRDLDVTIEFPLFLHDIRLTDSVISLDRPPR